MSEAQARAAPAALFAERGKALRYGCTAAQVVGTLLQVMAEAA